MMQHAAPRPKRNETKRRQVLWRKYGAVSIGTYFGIYFGSIAFFYVVYDYGVLTNLPSGGTAVIEHVSVFLFLVADGVTQ